eukprot:TRINITY_DN38220_c0_g1_i1.p1 TRINITY_DN38220_c0_g1~~TRINITY_DN38220_c0_g1_i1.p1  ORF type:complete len:716 (-),score=111.03 TRINITY_DN38220_c0_g1_i1:14-2161(-)
MGASFASYGGSKRRALLQRMSRTARPLRTFQRRSGHACLSSLLSIATIACAARGALAVETVLSSEWLRLSSEEFPKLKGEDLVVPSVLDCTYDEGWDSFRKLLQKNAAEGWHLDENVFDMADRLIAKHLFPFLDFHRSKSNEFFFDCDRPLPTGRICLYGMLSALFIHHVYLRHKLEASSEMATADDRSVFDDSTSVARLMLINKNNCMDFYDSSSWPITLHRLISVLRPPAVHPYDWTAAPARSSRWLAPARAAHLTAAGGADLRGRQIVVYITGTHAALGREPAEMLRRFAAPLLGCEVVPVLEIADTTHCRYVGCEKDSAVADDAEDAASALRFGDVGLRELAEQHFRARWTGLDIEDLPGMRRSFAARFAAHSLSREVDVFMCTSPAVLCTLLQPFGGPLLAYLGEPLLLSVPEDEASEWWTSFEAMSTAPGSFFACYNPFLANMVRYQTGLELPVVRLHGLYTGVVYSPPNPRAAFEEVLVVKGPNICLDPVCLLNRLLNGRPDGAVFASAASSEAAAARGGGISGRCGADTYAGAASPGSALKFVGLDEYPGASYARIAAFRAVVFYPYDVALALFYELYSMGVPLLLPRVDLLRFYVFRGLHSGAEYHRLGPGRHPSGDEPPPFIGPLDSDQWFRAAGYWSGVTDFARFPHLLRFGTAAEILSALRPGATDWEAISARMRRFNEEQLVVTAAQWAGAIAGAVGTRGAR